MFGRLFDKIFEVIKKILKWLGPLAIIVYILIWIFAPYLIPIIHAWLATAWAAIQAFAATAWATIGSWLSSAWTIISSWGGAAWDAASGWVAEASFGEVLKLATGAAIILNPEGAAEGIGTIIESIGSVVKDILGPYLPWVLGGLALWFFWPSGDNEETVVIETRSEPKWPN